MQPYSRRLREVLAEPVTVDGLVLRLARRADLREASAFLSSAEASLHDRAIRNGVAPPSLEGLASEFIRRGEIMMAEDGDGEAIGIFRVSNKNRTSIGWAFAPGWTARALHPILDALVGRLAGSWHDRIMVHLTGTAPAARAVLTDLGFSHPRFGGNTRDFYIEGQAYSERLSLRGDLPRWPAPRGRGVVTDQVRLVEPFERKSMPGTPCAVRDAFAEPCEGVGFTLRLAGYEDAGAVWGLDPDKVPLPDGREPHRSEMEDQCADGNVVVAEDASGSVVGSVFLRSIGKGAYVMGWQVRLDRRGEGLGSGMATAVAGRMFEAGAKRLVCGVSADNEASLRIAGRLGFPADAEPVRGVVWMDMDGEAFEARPRSGTPAPM